MAKRNNTTTEEKIKRWVAEGRGLGTGREYKPWLTIQDVPSMGRSHRVLGQKTGRLHHLLSDIEYGHFVIFDCADEVIDIREQFPLNRDETLQIAVDLGVRHPRAPGSSTYEVMTTDFLVTTYKRGVIAMTAYAVKQSESVAKRYVRTRQKLKIEKRYWQQRGVRWVLSTEKKLPKVLIRNIQWVRAAFDIRSFEQTADVSFTMLAKTLINSLTQRSSPKALNKFCHDLDRADGFDLGTYLGIARHLFAHKCLTMDFYRPNPWSAPANTIALLPPRESVIEIVECTRGDKCFS